MLVKQLSALRKDATVKKTLKAMYSTINLVELVNEMEKMSILSKRDAHNIKSNMESLSSDVASSKVGCAYEKILK